MTRRRPGSNVGPENHNVGPENHNVTVPEETALTVTFAGSGDAFGSGGRFQACIHLRGPGGPGPVLLDCGATALSALNRLGLDPGEIAAVFVSHLHGDHFGGLPFLILDGQFSRRTRPLVVAGPSGIARRLADAMECMFPGSSTAARRFGIDTVELKPGAASIVSGVMVSAWEGDHPAAPRPSSSASTWPGRRSPTPATPPGRTHWSMPPRMSICRSPRPTTGIKTSPTTSVSPTSTSDKDRGAALTLLARAAGQTGDSALCAQISVSYQKLVEAQNGDGPLFNPFTWREIQLRGLLDTGNHAAALRLAYETASCPAPAPQWQVIERITYADVLASAGDSAAAEVVLLKALDLGRQYRLPHQIQRAVRIAQRVRLVDLMHYADVGRRH
jgi:hypothetical protein